MRTNGLAVETETACKASGNTRMVKVEVGVDSGASPLPVLDCLLPRPEFAIMASYLGPER